MLEEICHCGRLLKFQSHVLFPLSSLCPVLGCQDVRSQFAATMLLYHDGNGLLSFWNHEP